MSFSTPSLTFSSQSQSLLMSWQIFDRNENRFREWCLASNQKSSLSRSQDSDYFQHRHSETRWNSSLGFNSNKYENFILQFFCEHLQIEIWLYRTEYTWKFLKQKYNWLRVDNGDKRFLITTERIEGYFTGTGDLFSALVTGWSSLEQNLPLAVHKAVSAIRSVLIRTSAHKDKAGQEILLVQSRRDIENPTLHGTLTLLDWTRQSIVFFFLIFVNWLLSLTLQKFDWTAQL
jgi:hypothetical protein